MDARLTRGTLAMGEVRAGFLRGIPSLLADFGHDPRRVLQDVGMDPARLSSPHGTLSFAQAAQLLARCARITGCPHFGVLAGERFDPTVFGETARLMRESSSVGAALQTFVLRHHLVDAGAVAMLLPVSRGRAGLAYSVYVPLAEGLDLITDIALACGFQLLRAMCGSAWQPLKVSLPHREPADATPYRRFFGQNVAFNANVASIAFSASWLRAPVANDSKRDARLARSAHEAEPLPDLPLRDFVLRALRPMLFTGMATQPNAARMFSMHPRTLSRALRAEGTSFLALLTDARMDIAGQLLRDTDLPVREIALALHYADASAFTKAFRARCGASPRDWRSRELAAAAGAGKAAARTAASKA